MPKQPIADKIRPADISEMVGQAHLFGKNGVVRRMIEKGYYTNMILFGPPGTGKTTCANIVAKSANMQLYKLNATTATLSDIKEVISTSNSVFGSNGVMLYLDEIQYFNKKQQQSLLEYIENGKITLIASTTENPYMCVYNAIISRSTMLEFKPVLAKDMVPALARALQILNKENEENKTADDDFLLSVAQIASGDVRRALNLLESAYYVSEGTKLLKEVLDSITPKIMGNFDASGTVHYDMLSALQKSIRGSDPDAAIFYLAKILEGGDLLGACRRLRVIASEDIGLAYPMACVIVNSCINDALNLGMPEARIPLAHATILLATSPKSNSAYLAYDRAKADIDAGKGQEVPPHMRPINNYANYKYPHDYPNHYVKQQYLPNDIKDAKYYEYGTNKVESLAKAYWDEIKKGL